jgi:hypothetical protein
MTLAPPAVDARHERKASQLGQRKAMKTAVRLTVAALCGISFCAGLMFGQNKKPSLTIDQKEKIEALENQSLRLSIDIMNIQQKYESEMRSDPQYSGDVQRQQEIGRELQQAAMEAQKGIDAARWQLNLNTLEFDPTPQAPRSAEKDASKK